MPNCTICNKEFQLSRVNQKTCLSEECKAKHYSAQDRIYLKQYRSDNAEHIKKYRELNREKTKEYNREYRENNSEYYREYDRERRVKKVKPPKPSKEKLFKPKCIYDKIYELRKEKIPKVKPFKPKCVYDKIYELRKEKVTKPVKPPKERKIPQDRKEYCKQYKRERRKGDIGFRLIEVLRSDFQRAFKGKGKKSKKTKEYIEFTVEEFQIHIESLFQEGMSWENWNRYGWHLDHVKPITSFKIINDGSENLEEIRACFALENLQPLWAKDNLSKGSKTFCV